MRWIFFSLVLLNLAALVYYWGRPDGAIKPAASSFRQQGEGLVLLSERSVISAPVSAPVTVADAVSEELPLLDTDEPAVDYVPEVEDDGSGLCTLIGPFSALLKAEYFQEYLDSLGVKGDVRELEVPGSPSYWVYQAPEPSRQEAYQRLRELQASGVDSYVIPKGELENGISFGLFSQESGAHQRLAQIVSQGYPASIKRVDRTIMEIWVSMTASESKKIEEKQWLELLSREEQLEMRQNFCPAVASD